tara:strand:- start:651 stop:785 length:135 start_codon:yes stop_codon:yes gene_type:complete
VKYNILVLCDFDPLKAKRVYSECSPAEIGEAIIAKRFYQNGDDA